MKFLRKIRVRGQPPLRRRCPGQGKIGRGVRQMAVRMHSGQYPVPNRQQAHSSVSEHTIIRQRAPRMASAARLAGRQRRRRAAGGRPPKDIRHAAAVHRIMQTLVGKKCHDSSACTRAMHCPARTLRRRAPCTYPPVGASVIRPNSVVSNRARVPKAPPMSLITAGVRCVG